MDFDSGALSFQVVNSFFLTAVSTHTAQSLADQMPLNNVILNILGRKKRDRLSVFPSPISSAPLTRIVILAVDFTCSHNPTAETATGPPVCLIHRAANPV